MGALIESTRPKKKLSLAEQLEQFQNNQATQSSNHPLVIPMIADCCQLEKDDNIYLLKCGHVMHQSCFKNSFQDYQNQKCFCGETSDSNIEF